MDLAKAPPQFSFGGREDYDVLARGGQRDHMDTPYFAVLENNGIAGMNAGDLAYFGGLKFDFESDTQVALGFTNPIKAVTGDGTRFVIEQSEFFPSDAIVALDNNFAGYDVERFFLQFSDTATQSNFLLYMQDSSDPTLDTDYLIFNQINLPPTSTFCELQSGNVSLFALNPADRAFLDVEFFV